MVKKKETDAANVAGAEGKAPRRNKLAREEAAAHSFGDLLEEDEEGRTALHECTQEQLDMHEASQDISRDETMLARGYMSLLQGKRSQNSGDSAHYKVSACIVHGSGALLFEEREIQRITGDFMEAKGADDGEDDEWIEKATDAGGEDPWLPTERDDKPDEVTPKKKKKKRHSFGTGRSQRRSRRPSLGSIGSDKNGIRLGVDAVSVAGTMRTGGTGLPHTMLNTPGKSPGPPRRGREPEEEEEPVDDDFALLDPYSNDGIEDTPFTRGATWREPTEPRSYLKQQESQDYAYLSIILNPHASKANTQSRKLKVPLYQEFMPLYFREMARRKRVLKRLLRKIARDKLKDAGASKDVIDHLLDRDVGDPDFEPLDGVDDDFEKNFGTWSDVEMDEGGDDDLWEGKGGKKFHNRDAQMEGAQLMQLDFRMNQQYLELCRKHVKHYLTRANKYARESTLSKRVADWTERLKPVLRKEQRRVKFNIKKYSRKIISRVDQIGQYDTEARARQGEAAAAPEVNFAHVMNGAPKYEVCRAFLTTLFLTNQGNFDLEMVEEEDGFKSFNLQLLRGDLSKVDFADEQANQA